MKSRFTAPLAAGLIVFLLLSVAAPCAAVDSTVSYYLTNPSDGSFTHTLNVVIPQSLTEYYNGLSHRSASIADFPKFVTPYALQPIADHLRQIYPDDEDFTNGVLALVHQIPYQDTLQAYYPTETMLRNSGDCDLLSLVAASILMAGGLDVVLLYYESEAHMNVGVHLAETPKDAQRTVFSLQSGNVTYYVAEVTSKNWKVGECPEDLKNIPVQIVPLEDREQIAPGQVFASFRKLDPTALNLEVSPILNVGGGTITMRGQITPAVPNENVTLYQSNNGAPWEVLTTVKTQTNGHFEYAWTPQVTVFVDQLDVRASWAGNQQYAGTTSQTKNSITVSFFTLMLIGTLTATIVLVCVVATRRRKTESPEPIEAVNAISPHPEPPAPQSDDPAPE